MRVEGDDSGESGCLHLRDLPLSVLCSLGWGRSAETSALNGSATIEPMRQVFTYRLTTLSTDLLVKSFVCCIMHHVPTCSGLHDFQPLRLQDTVTMGRISVVSLLDGWGCFRLGRMMMCEDLVYV